MDFIKYLEDNRQHIIDKWRQSIFDTYPMDSGKFLLGNKNRFANPIGFTINEELPKIFDQLLEKMNHKFDGLKADEMKNSIENLIKIRAVQNFTPTEAIGFINQLKNIIKNEVKENLNDSEFIISYFDFDKYIDNTMEIAYEIFLDSKYKLYEIKLNEVKKRNEKMMERISRKYDNNG